jgi:hypothetical protein
LFETKFKAKKETRDLYLSQLFLQGENIFLSSKAPKPVMGHNQPPA